MIVHEQFVSVQEIDRGTKKQRERAQKALQGYEKNPPRCLNCIHFQQVQPRNAEAKYKPAMCRYGEFAVTWHGICDFWHGIDGATLSEESES